VLLRQFRVRPDFKVALTSGDGGNEVRAVLSGDRERSRFYTVPALGNQYLETKTLYFATIALQRLTNADSADLAR
jgi:hypothetical protein